MSAPSSIEQLDDRLRRARELAQRSRDWYRWESTPLGERYLKGNVNIGLRCVDSGPPYYGVVFEASPAILEAKLARPLNVADNHPRTSDIDANKLPMLPSNVECVQVKQVIVPSRPRLQLFDDFSVVSGQKLYLFMSRVLTMQESVPTGADGELRMFWVRMVVADGERIGEKVKTAPQAIDDQSGFGVYNVRQWPNLGEFVKLLGFLRIYLLDDFIWGECAPGVDSCLKNWELGIGPLNSSVSI